MWTQPFSKYRFYTFMAVVFLMKVTEQTAFQWLKSMSCSFCNCQWDYYSLGKTKPWKLITVDCQKFPHKSISAYCK